MDNHCAPTWLKPKSLATSSACHYTPLLHEKQGEMLWSNLLRAYVSQSTSKSDIVARSLLLVVRPGSLRRFKLAPIRALWKLSRAIGLGAVFLNKVGLKLRFHCANPNNRAKGIFRFP